MSSVGAALPAFLIAAFTAFLACTTEALAAKISSLPLVIFQPARAAARLRRAEASSSAWFGFEARLRERPAALYTSQSGCFLK